MNKRETKGKHGREEGWEAVEMGIGKTERLTETERRSWQDLGHNWELQT